MERNFYVYIITNKRRTVFYAGVTNNLVRRVYEHKNKLIKGFTAKYQIDQLVYFEHLNDPANAIIREKQVKDYRRSKKIALIEAKNSKWEDLYAEIL